jgi:hypothetical protein
MAETTKGGRALVSGQMRMRKDEGEGRLTKGSKSLDNKEPPPPLERRRSKVTRDGSGEDTSEGSTKSGSGVVDAD